MNFTLYICEKNVDENVAEVEIKICDPGIFAQKPFLHFRDIAFKNKHKAWQFLQLYFHKAP